MNAILKTSCDAAMLEMANIHPPMRRSECERLIRAALSALATPQAPAPQVPEIDRDEVRRVLDIINDFTDDTEIVVLHPEYGDVTLLDLAVSDFRALLERSAPRGPLAEGGNDEDA
ncbi:hypothetical protein C5748_25785 [Phyllobacterium phragmitis]|uniref:Uncharacterized protein n=1 Tax=Phyllobacterium phragmitis TaxID=2670329 RepID=A0A2S9IJI8_9HYPH|nr:hypothetical protein [Phyllobacterium phragmitis]PRD40679.1 hypothetical protein C5748_25785 [Phyllobacterium phragmitis]